MMTSHKTEITILGLATVLVLSGPVWSSPDLIRQIGPLRQDSVKAPAVADVGRQASPSAVAPPMVDSPGGMSNGASPVEPVTPRSYDPSGRRDPFAPIVQQFGLGAVDQTLPPLQRVGLTEMNLIAVIWGGYGYTAMVQTPDGNGYTVRRGTRIGPNNGVVSAITEKGIIVQERFTDVYGKKQEREYVKLLHPKEGLE
ncbi:MAG TPA: pilus assembly protein PilP [Nitrospiraceae bacterium]